MQSGIPSSALLFQEDAAQQGEFKSNGQNATPVILMASGIYYHAFASNQNAIHTLKDIHVKKASHFHVDQTRIHENGHRLEVCVRMECINHVTIAQELQAIRRAI